MPGLEGTRLGRYRLQRRLGRGGMSEVYLAYDELMHRDVAIKVVSSSHADYIERFKREAQAIGNLHHNHILPAFDYGEHKRWHYLVMPYIEHETLRERLERGPLTLVEAGEMLSQIASGLQYAHEHGILHRDIKPSNILLRDDHHAYLADFGLAKAVDGAGSITRTGVLLGTPEYMAPELAYAPASISSDIYALGILLYQMVTRQLPFTGGSALAVYLKQMHEQPLPPSRLNPAIPQDVERVILRALDKDPQRRFQTPDDLTQAYLRALRDEEKLVLPEYQPYIHTSAQTTAPADQTIIQELARPAAPTSRGRPVRSTKQRSTHRSRNVFAFTSFMGFSFLLIFMSVILFAAYSYGGSTRTRIGNASTVTPQATITSQVSVTNGTQTIASPTLIASVTTQTPAQKAVATASAITGGAPLLTDDLSANNNSWVEDTACIFMDGTYHTVVKQANLVVPCESTSLSFENAALQVDVSLLSGNDAGLIFRVNDQQFYDFEITNQGQFFFRRHDPSASAAEGSYKYLINDAKSSAIAPGNQKNSLLVIANGSDFILFINGTFVGEAQDSTYTRGQVGFVIGTLPAVTSGEASFANFNVYAVS